MRSPEALTRRVFRYRVAGKAKADRCKSVGRVKADRCKSVGRVKADRYRVEGKAKADRYRVEGKAKADRYRVEGKAKAERLRQAVYKKQANCPPELVFRFGLAVMKVTIGMVAAAMVFVLLLLRL